MSLVDIDWGFGFDETFWPVFRKRRKIGELVRREGGPWSVSWWRGNKLDRVEVEYRCRLANAEHPRQALARRGR